MSGYYPDAMNKALILRAFHMEFIDVGLGVHAPRAVVFGGEDGHFGKPCFSAVVDGVVFGLDVGSEVLNEEIRVLIRLCAVPPEVVDDGIPSLLWHVHPKSEGTRSASWKLRLVHSKEYPETIKFLNNRIVHNFQFCHVPSVMSDTPVRGL